MQAAARVGIAVLIHVCLSACLSVCLCVCVCLSVSVRLSSMSVSLSLSLSLSVYLPISHSLWPRAGAWGAPSSLQGFFSHITRAGTIPIVLFFA